MDSKKILIGLMLGGILGALAVIISWFLGSEASPFYEYFLQNVILPNLWMLLNFPAFMLLVITGARSFQLGLLMIFLQWFVIGIFLMWVFSRFGRRKTN